MFGRLMPWLVWGTIGAFFGTIGELCCRIILDLPTEGLPRAGPLAGALLGALLGEVVGDPSRVRVRREFCCCAVLGILVGVVIGGRTALGIGQADDDPFESAGWARKGIV